MNKTDEGALETEVALTRFWQRLLGLSPLGKLGEKHLGWVFIPHCQMIHTFSLRRPIDLEWIDRNRNVIRRDTAVPPRSIRSCPGAFGVRERYAFGASRSQGGWGTSETLIALPFFLLICFVAIQLSFIGIANLHLGHALREGLRSAAAELSKPTSNVGKEMNQNGDAIQTMFVQQAIAYAAFDQAIERGLRAWSGFYGEASATGRGSLLKLEGRFRAARLESSTSADEASEAADHLVGELGYWMPLKLPLIGRSMSLVMPFTSHCDTLNTRIRLCVEEARWYLRMEKHARIPLPEIGLAGRLNSDHDPFVSSRDSINSGDGAMSPIAETSGLGSGPEAAEPNPPDAWAQAAIDPKNPGRLYPSDSVKPGTPQTIEALLAEASVSKQTQADRHQAIDVQCGIQFGS